MGSAPAMDVGPPSKTMPKVVRNINDQTQSTGVRSEKTTDSNDFKAGAGKPGDAPQITAPQLKPGQSFNPRTGDVTEQVANPAYATWKAQQDALSSGPVALASNPETAKNFQKNRTQAVTQLGTDRRYSFDNNSNLFTTRSSPRKTLLGQ